MLFAIEQPVLPCESLTFAAVYMFQVVFLTTKGIVLVLEVMLGVPKSPVFFSQMAICALETMFFVLEMRVGLPEAAILTLKFVVCVLESRILLLERIHLSRKRLLLIE